MDPNNFFQGLLIRYLPHAEEVDLDTSKRLQVLDCIERLARQVTDLVLDLLVLLGSRVRRTGLLMNLKDDRWPCQADHTLDDQLAHFNALIDDRQVVREVGVLARITQALDFCFGRVELEGQRLGCNLKGTHLLVMGQEPASGDACLAGRWRNTPTGLHTFWRG